MDQSESQIQRGSKGDLRILCLYSKAYGKRTTVVLEFSDYRKVNTVVQCIPRLEDMFGTVPRIHGDIFRGTFRGSANSAGDCQMLNTGAGFFCKAEPFVFPFGVCLRRAQFVRF